MADGADNSSRSNAYGATMIKAKEMTRNLLSILKVCVLLMMPLLGQSVYAGNYPTNDDYLWVTIPDHNNWIYQVGQTAKVEVTLLKYGQPVTGKVDYSIGGDLQEADETGSLSLHNGRATATIKSPKSAGFRDLRLRYADHGKTTVHHVKVAFSPDQIRPWTMEPADFDSYWTKEIAENEKTPMQYTMKKVEQYCNNAYDCYLVKLLVSPDRQYFYGYLTIPHGAKAGSCPVVLCPPGAGFRPIACTSKNNLYAAKNLIRFSFEIHGLGPSISPADYNDISNAFGGHYKDYLYHGLETRQGYYLHHVYLGLHRIIDFLTLLPEWDGKNVIAQGGSQGGALSLVAAGLDNRVTLCVVNHPALSDMAANYGHRPSGYPHIKASEGVLNDQTVKVLSYFDVVNFAKRVKAHTFMTWGFNDNTCPPTTSYAVWNSLTCDKESLITPINEHWTSSVTDNYQVDWIADHLR